VKDTIRSIKYSEIFFQVTKNVLTNENVKRNMQITVIPLGQRRVMKCYGDTISDTAWKMKKGFIEALKNRCRGFELTEMQGKKQ
jgi:hypothetical protein